MNNHNLITRNVFHKIHKKQISSKIGFKKVSSLLNHKNLKLNKNYFKDAICGDFGCGSTGAGGFNLLNLGAKYVHLVDLGKHIIKPINNNLKKFSDKYEINISSIENTNFKKNYFDFILCQGVIHHAKNDENCFKEIKRVLKPGGKCLIMVAGEGGLISDFVMKYLRPQYKQNKNIKKFINKIMYNKISGYKKFYLNNIDNQTKKIVKFLGRFIDDDLFLTIQDRVLAPKYKTYNEQKLVIYLKKMGFGSIYRIKKKVSFNNLRRLLSPFYFYYKHEISRALYGEGNITLMMTKKQKKP